MRANVAAFGRWLLAAADARRRRRGLDRDDGARGRPSRCRCSSRRSRCSGSARPGGRGARRRAAARAAGTLFCVSTMTTRAHDEVAAVGAGAALAPALRAERPAADARPRRRGARGRLLRARTDGRHRRTSACASATCGSASRCRRGCRCRTSRGSIRPTADDARAAVPDVAARSPGATSSGSRRSRSCRSC